MKHELKQKYCISNMLTVNCLISLAFILHINSSDALCPLKSSRKQKDVYL